MPNGSEDELKNLPLWVKALGAAVLIALTVGGARLLVWLDTLGGAPGGPG